MVEKLLTISEVANRLRLPEAEVQQLVAAGRLKALRLGGELLRFHPDDVAKFHESRLAIRDVPSSRRERLRDLFYTYDFYLVAALLIGILLILIVSRP